MRCVQLNILRHCHSHIFTLIFIVFIVQYFAGILNIWTPVYPDGSYRLNLSAWDNREAAKILFKLAEVEPGENLINETFRPSLIEDPIPGWELPMPWTVCIRGSGSYKLDIYFLFAHNLTCGLPTHLRTHHDRWRGQGQKTFLQILLPIVETMTSTPLRMVALSINVKEQLVDDMVTLLLNIRVIQRRDAKLVPRHVMQ